MEERKTARIKKFGRSLSYSDAMEIRERYAGTYSLKPELALEFGVSEKTIERIIYWETYRQESFKVGRKSRHY